MTRFLLGFGHFAIGIYGLAVVILAVSFWEKLVEHIIRILSKTFLVKESRKATFLTEPPMFLLVIASLSLIIVIGILLAPIPWMADKLEYWSYWH